MSSRWCRIIIFFLPQFLFATAYAASPEEAKLQAEKWYQQPTSIVCSENAPAMVNIYSHVKLQDSLMADGHEDYFRKVEGDQKKKRAESCSTLQNSGGVVEAMYSGCQAACEHEAHTNNDEATIGPSSIHECKGSCAEEQEEGKAFLVGYRTASETNLKADCNAKIQQIHKELNSQNPQASTSTLTLIKNLEAIISGSGSAPRPENPHPSSGAAKMIFE